MASGLGHNSVARLNQFSRDRCRYCGRIRIEPGVLKTDGYPGTRRYPGTRGVITRRVQIPAGIEVEPYPLNG